MEINLYKRILGSMLGGAAGDALGAPLEFMRLSQIQKRYGQNGLDHYIEGAGDKGFITDDTQMTLFTAEGLLCSRQAGIMNGGRKTEIDLVFRSYQRWLLTQRQIINLPPEEAEQLDRGWLIKTGELFSIRAPGNTCLSALRSGECGHWDQPINNSKGCGGIMRVAPVGLLYYTNPVQAFRSACQAAAITHGHPSGYLTAGCLASIIAFILQGLDLKTAIASTIEILKTWPEHMECLKAIEMALKLYETDDFSLEKIQMLGEGWVGEETLSISIYCALIFQSDFKGGVRAAANHSGDCDSTGAVTGNILGALLGSDSIPTDWIDNLAEARVVEKLSGDILKVLAGDPETMLPSWMDSYLSD